MTHLICIAFLLVLSPAMLIQASKTDTIHDSYLSAYSEVHGGKLDRISVSKNDRDYSLHNNAEYPNPPSGPAYTQDNYLPQSPSQDFPYPPSASAPQYGPPKPAYGPPKPVYGPPAPR